jgi:hypothetical protein
MMIGVIKAYPPIRIIVSTILMVASKVFEQRRRTGFAVAISELVP